jgi:hypothetical protein
VKIHPVKSCRGQTCPAGILAAFAQIVHDALSRSRAFRNLSKKVAIRGDEMTVKVGRRQYKFEVERDENGWVTGANPVTDMDPR